MALRAPTAETAPCCSTTSVSACAITFMRGETITTVAPRADMRETVSTSAASPLASRWAFGSSSTSRATSPNTARARPMRWRCPPESGAPPGPIRVP